MVGLKSLDVSEEGTYEKGKTREGERAKGGTREEMWK